MSMKRSLIAAIAMSCCLGACALSIAPQQAYAAADAQVVTPVVYNQNGKTSKNIYVNSSSQEAAFSLVRQSYTAKKYASRSLAVVSDSNYAGTYTEPYSTKHGDNECIGISLTGTGKHVIVIRETFKNAKGKAVHYTDYSVTLKLKRIGLECTDNGFQNGIGNDSIVAYPKATRSIKARNLTEVAGWTIEDELPQTDGAAVAAVSASGTVTCLNPGRCYVTATGISKKTGVVATYKILLEVCHKKAYRAVQNAYEDYFNDKIAYNQGKRMKKSFRDCSSFVGRCYYDAKLGRTLLSIGGDDAKSWALPAADQAMWLKKHKAYIAGGKTKKGKNALAREKLLPGDTIYYSNSRSSKNSKAKLASIDHASIYVGNGKVLDVSGSTRSGRYGAVRFRFGYSEQDTTVIFVSRPTLAK